MISRALTVLSDERLAHLAATGSDPAFAALYNRYSGTLFAYCRSITRNPDDGWDALQNAMIKVLVALRRTPDRSAPVRPWLFCICHNEAVGILRRRSAAERVAGAATCTVVAGADEEALVREVVSEVVSDVQQLPTGQRAALVMRELADLQYDEIATALSTTEGNARQLVFAARAGLRDSRAGRGLPCESVRDQLSLADGRLLRRRSVRAHLRTCDGCRAYASTMRRRGGQPARSLSAWTPLAGYQLLESVFRAAAGPGAAALVQGGSSMFAPLAAKAAAATVVLAAGLGAADVATMKPPSSHSAEPARAAVAAKPAAKQASGRGAANRRAAAHPSPAPVHIAPAVYHAAGGSATGVKRNTVAGQRASTRAEAESTHRPAPSSTSSDPAPRHQSAPQSEEPRAERTQQPDRGDCPSGGRQDAAAERPPQQQQPAGGVREDLAYTGPTQPDRGSRQFADAR